MIIIMIIMIIIIIIIIIIASVKREGVLKESTAEILKENTERKRTADYHTKPLNGQFERATKEDQNTDTWLWLSKNVLKKETEGLVTAAQDQALKTNSIRKAIDGKDI